MKKKLNIKSKLLIVIILIISIIVALLAYIQVNKLIKQNENANIKTLVIGELNIDIETYHAKDNQIKLLVTATCKDGIKSLKQEDDGFEVYAGDNKQKVSMDYNINNNGIYTFSAVSLDGDIVKKQITIDDEYINKLINPIATSNNKSEALFNLDIEYPNTILNRTLHNYYKFSENEEWSVYQGKQELSVFNMSEYIDEDLNLTVYMKQNDDIENEIISVQKIPINTIAQLDMFIFTVADLQKLQEYVNLGATYEGKTIYLMRDLDLSSVCSETKGTWTPIGKYVSDNEIYSFCGTFEGKNHTIKNIYINSSVPYQGLFRSSSKWCN